MTSLNTAARVREGAAAIAEEISQPLKDGVMGAIGEVPKAAQELAGILSFFEISPLSARDAQMGMEMAAKIAGPIKSDITEAVKLSLMGVSEGAGFAELARGRELAPQLKV